MIKAFTIVELVAVLLLTSVILLLGYSGYSTFQAQIEQFRRRQILIEENFRLDYFLTADFSIADSVYIEGNQLSLHKRNDPIGLYLFNDDHVIVRNRAGMDTLSSSIDIIGIMKNENPKFYSLSLFNKEFRTHLSYKTFIRL